MKQQYAVTSYVPICNRSFLTPNKEYPILDNFVDWADDKCSYSSFEILDDDGDKIYCLVEACAYLDDGQWTIIEK